MKTKIELGNSVNSILYSSMDDALMGGVSEPLFKLVWTSVNDSVWGSVHLSVRDSINNSMIWEIEL